VLLRALRRFASAFLALVMCSFLSLAKTPSGRLLAKPCAPCHHTSRLTHMPIGLFLRVR
jgi:hypothetical protein